MDNSVEIDNLRKTFIVKIGRGFRRTRREVVAVDGISLAIPAGQAVAFIGPNGAGKSTTIKMLTGILHPTSGCARVLGFTPWRERRTLVRQIGAVFGQRSQLWYHLPPRDTFELLARIYDIPHEQYRRRRDVLIERFGLAPWRPSKLYYPTFGTRFARTAVNTLRLLGRDPRRFGQNADIDAVRVVEETTPITTTIDCADWLEPNLRARLCHRSQLGGAWPYEHMPRALQRRFFGAEHFTRVIPAWDGTRELERDLFEAIPQP
jgi:ABC-type uncharacterized transport system YnjBCD ATPase subunit